MDSALSPREIQARVRAGATLAEVATEAGVSEDKVEPFASPVLAERTHVAGTAQQSTLRRPGEPGPHLSLRHAVTPQLAQRGVNYDDVTWDAWRTEDRRWTVRASWREKDDEGASVDKTADFVFDQNSRFSLPSDQEARDLVGERPKPAPSPVSLDPDSEPTLDLDDEMAIIRATQPDDPPRPANGLDMEFSEVELAQVDGVYDFVPGSTQLDTLYDMLSGIDEDSVHVYDGLQPVTETGGEQDDAQPELEEQQPVDPIVKPEQEPLVELSQPIPTRPRAKRGHAAVPSWDEILFGSAGKKPRGKR